MFTLVFDGDIRTFKANPFKTETPFGIPVAAGVGDAFEMIDALEEQLEKAAARPGMADAAFVKLRRD